MLKFGNVLTRRTGNFLPLSSFNPSIIYASVRVINPALNSSSSFSVRHKITEKSWAAQNLKSQGETVAKAEAEPITEVNVEMLRNPSDNVKRISDEILSLSFLEVNQLMLHLQARLGISDEVLYGGFGGGGGGGGGAAVAAPVEEVKVKEAFDVKLAAVDAKAKIKVIKEVRAITGLGLKEAKELVENAPCVLKEGLKKEEADAMQKILTEAGATVEIL